MSEVSDSEEPSAPMDPLTALPPQPGVAAARTRAWRNGLLLAEDFPVADISDHLDSDPDVVVWVDLCEPDRDQLLVLAEELSLHELAVEDALGPHQRPKLDHYDTHQFLSIRSVRLDPDSGELDETEIDAFINPRWIITIRRDDRFPIEPVVERWDRSAALAHHGVAFLLHGLLDHVVDEYFVAIDRFDDFYDKISEELFDERPLDPTDQRHWFTIRRSLVRFHRLAMSMREAVSSIMRREQGLAGDLYPYYQDVYDHVLRIGESSDALRDLGATIVETNLALRDFRQNQVVKRVGSWAAIIAVPTLVTGYYGMNVPYPGSDSTTGVAVSGALALGLPIGLFLYFRRKEWL